MIADMPTKPKSKMPRAAGKPKRTPSRKRPRPSRNAAAERDPDVPYWLPAGDRWNDLPAEIRQAVPRILVPAYRRFVLDAPGELERSIGLTLVHLMWLELCGQTQLAVAAADPTALAAILQNPDDMIDRHLHLVTTKCQTAELLVKLRVMNEMLQRPPAPVQPALPPPLDVLGRVESGEGRVERVGLPTSALPLLPSSFIPEAQIGKS
jgi:hypothetical protein